MGAFIAGTGYDLKHLLNNYPWASVGEGTIVDVSSTSQTTRSQPNSPCLRLQPFSDRWLSRFCQRRDRFFIPEDTLYRAGSATGR